MKKIVIILVLILVLSVFFAISVKMIKDNKAQEDVQGHVNTVLTPSERVLSSIEITTPSIVKAYNVGEAFNPTGMIITATYEDGEKVSITNTNYFELKKVFSNGDTFVTSYNIEPSKLALTDTYITVSYTENGITKTATQPITVYGSTLGELVSGSEHYGKTVSYSANGVSDWKVLYKQTVDNEDYIYLISSSVLNLNQIPFLDGVKITPTGMNWEIVPNAAYDTTDAYKYFMATYNDGNYTKHQNEKCVSQLLCTKLWSSFVNESYKDYIIGVIGSPTLEMLLASWNTIGDKQLEITPGHELGYYINKATNLSLSNNNTLYFPFDESKYKYCVAAVCGIDDESVYCVYSHSELVNRIGAYPLLDINCSVRPVVCIKASVPAYWTDEAIKTDITLGTKNIVQE